MAVDHVTAAHETKDDKVTLAGDDVICVARLALSLLIAENSNGSPMLFLINIHPETGDGKRLLSACWRSKRAGWIVRQKSAVLFQEEAWLYG